MQFVDFVQALRNIPGVQVSWVNEPSFPIRQEPVYITNTYDDETTLHFHIFMDTNEVGFLYGYTQEKTEYGRCLPEAIPMVYNKKDSEDKLKEIIANYANAEGDGGGISKEDVVF